MREPLAKHEIIEYQHNEPFFVARADRANADRQYVQNSHWHEELELSYILRGHYRHFIDGEYVEAEPGRLIITNCESVHRIDLTGAFDDPEEPAEAVVLIVHNRFIEENFPEYRDFQFTNEKRQARPEIREIMLKFSEYRSREEHAPHEHLYMRGLLLQLLYYLYQEGNVSRKQESGAERRAQVQTLKEILQYVENHYRESLSQASIAREFFFTPQYFAHYFKKCTGVTFTEHLTAYRLQQARLELLHTDKRIGDIARDNGFNDDRSFINAFKKRYQSTPLQYKKQLNAKMVV